MKTAHLYLAKSGMFIVSYKWRNGWAKCPYHTLAEAKKAIMRAAKERGYLITGYNTLDHITPEYINNLKETFFKNLQP